MSTSQIRRQHGRINRNVLIVIFGVIVVILALIFGISLRRNSQSADFVPSPIPAREHSTKTASRDGKLSEVFVFGSVKQPGGYELFRPDLTVRQIIKYAGGANRQDIVKVFRPTSGHSKMVVNASIAQLQDGQAPDIYLKPNDIIEVFTPRSATRPSHHAANLRASSPIDASGTLAKAGLSGDRLPQVYISGVSRPGVYQLFRPDLTVRQIIKSAGGADRLDTVKVIRRTGSNESMVVNASFAQLQDGLVPDIDMKAEDIIEIFTPRSATRPSLHAAKRRADMPATRQ